MRDQVGAQGSGQFPMTQTQYDKIQLRDRVFQILKERVRNVAPTDEMLRALAESIVDILPGGKT